MYKLVLIRNGESTWNLENRFTGWTDVDLTPTGIDQAQSAGKLLKAENYDFDLPTPVCSNVPRAHCGMCSTKWVAPGCRWCTAGG